MLKRTPRKGRRGGEGEGREGRECEAGRVGGGRWVN